MVREKKKKERKTVTSYKKLLYFTVAKCIDFVTKVNETKSEGNSLRESAE